MPRMARARDGAVPEAAGKDHGVGIVTEAAVVLAVELATLKRGPSEDGAAVEHTDWSSSSKSFSPAFAARMARRAIGRLRAGTFTRKSNV